MCATSTVSARRGCVEEVQKVEVAGYVLLQTLILLYRLLESSIGLRSPSDRIAFGGGGKGWGIIMNYFGLLYILATFVHIIV